MPTETLTLDQTARKMIEAATGPAPEDAILQILEAAVAQERAALGALAKAIVALVDQEKPAANAVGICVILPMALITVARASADAGKPEPAE